MNGILAPPVRVQAGSSAFSNHIGDSTCLVRGSKDPTTKDGTPHPEDGGCERGWYWAFDTVLGGGLRPTLSADPP